MIKIIPPKHGVAPATRLALLARLSPDDANRPGSQQMLLSTLVEMGEYDRAREVAMALASNRAADRETQAAARKTLARSLYELRHYDELLTLLDELLQAEPNDANMINLLANVHLEMRDYDAALTAAEQAIALAPNEPTAFSTLLKAAGAKDRFGMVFNEARRSIDNGHRNAGVLAAFLHAGLATGAKEVKNFTDDTIACITPVVGHAVLKAIDRDSIYRKIIESADLIDSPSVYASQNAKRMKLYSGGVTSDLLCLFEAAAEIAEFTIEKLDRKSLIANNIPETVSISAWTTVYGTGGRETPHYHPSGWFSGVYYPAAKDMDEIHGSLCFGFPPPGKDATDADIVVKIDPKPGQLILFPSYLLHWTAAPLVTDKRVSLAFDFKPVSA